MVQHLVYAGMFETEQVDLAVITATHNCSSILTEHDALHIFAGYRYLERLRDYRTSNGIDIEACGDIVDDKILLKLINVRIPAVYLSVKFTNTVKELTHIGLFRDFECFKVAVWESQQDLCDCLVLLKAQDTKTPQTFRQIQGRRLRSLHPCLRSKLSGGLLLFAEYSIILSAFLG